MKSTWFQAITRFLLYDHASESSPASPAQHLVCSDKCISVETLQPRFFPELQSQRLKIRYGPLTAPSAHDNGGMASFYFPIQPPCTDCLLTHIQADLEYANGSYANVNTGLSLHHVVIGNLRLPSVTCPYVPERLFASGNERTPANICLNGTQKAGYHVSDNDSFQFLAELMNEVHEERAAIISIDWEFVPSAAAVMASSAFASVTPLWLDIAGTCGENGSEVAVPIITNTTATSNTSTGAMGSTPADAFSLVMDPPWTSNFSAKVLLALGHLHDGGIDFQVIAKETNKDAVVCNSVAGYGESAGYVVDHPVHHHDGDDDDDDHDHESQHFMTEAALSSMSSCAASGVRIKAGEKWSVQANYNFTQHAATHSHEDGMPAPVMGITLMYVVKDS